MDLKIRVWFNGSFQSPSSLLKDGLLGFDNYRLVGKYEEIRVSLYTGVNDKVGNEIYEGDIIADPTAIYLVMFHNGQFLCFDSIKAYKNGHATGKLDTKKDKVIGNIYENPEIISDEVIRV